MRRVVLTCEPPQAKLEKTWHSRWCCSMSSRGSATDPPDSFGDQVLSVGDADAACERLRSFPRAHSASPRAPVEPTAAEAKIGRGVPASADARMSWTALAVR